MSPAPSAAAPSPPSPLLPAPPLPSRVLKAIHDQQDASERLICWVQLAVVTLFGGLYLVAPKTVPEDAEFAPVPWVLGFYLIFTLARLAAVHRGRAKDWLLYLSALVDMGLLFALIWSFHLQYMQPAVFYLKAPTLLYVFIFIALRALRFEARFVVFSGLVAAIGWSLMALYAVTDSNGMTLITTDYVLYLTSNRVLIGAEIDKIVSILTVTAIIAVAIARARRLLVRAVAEGAAAHELSRFFSPEIARRITAADHEAHIGEGEARNAAILFCDIRGFTVFAKSVDPATLMRTLADYQARMVAAIRRHGGSIDKFLGDGIMATFGASTPADSCAADALRAIDDIMATAAAWNAERDAAGLPVFRIGAAASAGRVIVGAVGDETRLEYTVIGDAVNRAAKLEKHTKTEKIRALTDAATYQAALDQGYTPAGERERRDARLIEGIDAPVDLVVMAA